MDISLRSTGIVCVEDGQLLDFMLVDYKPPTNGEELLSLNSKTVERFVAKNKIDLDLIAIERFSFGASSGSMDLLWANAWCMRTRIWESGIRVPLEEISVMSWRNPLFTKTEADELKAAAKKLKLEKVPIKGLSGEDRKIAMSNNRILEEAACLKRATVGKLPEDVVRRFETYLEEHGAEKTQIFDLADAYFVAMHCFKK